MCTHIRMKASNGDVVVGRTQEIGLLLGSELVAVPRGHRATAKAPSGAGATWTTSYGIVGVDVFGNVDTVQDGMNDQGLYAGVSYMDDFCQYADPEKCDPATLIADNDIAAYVLGTCATVADAAEAMTEKVTVWAAPLPEWGYAPPLHLALSDATGACGVIEFEDGAAVFRDNPLGVVSNQPYLDWHYTNIRNYVNLTSRLPHALMIGEVELAPLGHGAGFQGFPGDASSPSRFVRATAFAATHTAVPDGAALEHAMFHIMNNFDIPSGSVRGEDGTYVEHTRFTSIANLTDLHYIVRGAGDPTPRRIDLRSTQLSSGPPRHFPLPVEDFQSLTI